MIKSMVNDDELVISGADGEKKHESNNRISSGETFINRWIKQLVL